MGELRAAFSIPHARKHNAQESRRRSGKVSSLPSQGSARTRAGGRKRGRNEGFVTLAMFLAGSTHLCLAENAQGYLDGGLHGRARDCPAIAREGKVVVLNKREEQGDQERSQQRSRRGKPMRTRTKNRRTRSGAVGTEGGVKGRGNEDGGDWD